MEDIKLPVKIEATNNEGNKARMIIEPCHPGYGVTLGNALRRVLLSSLPGSAVTAMKIKGVDHEFSTIPEIKEDVVEIILNLKKLRIKSHADEPVRVSLSHKGKGPIKAKEFVAISDIEIVDPEYIIANATGDKANFNLEVVVENGRGYLPVEQRNTKDLEIGMIAIDALFSPIDRVGYKVENMRVGQMTDYDRLLIDIETNGVISPEEAFKSASLILSNHFSLLSGEKELPAREINETEEESGKQENKEGDAQESQGIFLEGLKLSTRTYNSLSKAGIKTLDEVNAMDDDKLLALDGFGETALKEIKKVLKKNGFERE